MSKSDPVRDTYFRPVERADQLIDWLFYISGALSIATLFVDEGSHKLFNGLWIVFIIAVTALFIATLVQRLYFTSRAEDRRVTDFFSSSHAVPLDYQGTDGYYNNGFSAPAGRIAAQVLENSHFSKAIAREMARNVRWITGVYASLWLVCLSTRDSSLPLVLVATQFFFSEQIASRFWRLEWLRMRFESIYTTMYNTFQNGSTDSKAFAATAISEYTKYEKAKSNAGVTLSGKIFARRNDELSAKWDEIKAALKIPS